jgi:crossover junction endodeoxyribonuclease RusA
MTTKITAARDAQWARTPQPKIVLTLPFPPSTNALWRHGGKGKGYRSARYVQWSRVAGLDLNIQKPGCIEGPYKLRLVLGKPDDRRRDADNFVKAVSDLLVEHRVIDDDSKATEISVTWSDRISGCRVHLTAARSAA